MSQSKSQHFGTDGIRGTVGKAPITPDFLVKLGWAVGKMLADTPEKTVLIGKDTRISGYMIESALETGLSAAGCNIYLVGPVPTPAVAYLTRTLRTNLGIVISASHNHYTDNGIKFFSSEGYKISDETEKAIEHWLAEPLVTLTSKDLGKAKRINDASGRYIEFCKSSVPHRTDLKNLKIVIDCANGSAYRVAPDVFAELGAEVITTYAIPNGVNINEKCGSEYPKVIQHRVLEEKADVGIAFDGDADRVIMVDHRGEILDGDELLYIISKSLIDSKHMTGGVIGTHMSNIGLEIALNELGTHLFRVPVGDQHIINELIQKKWLLGGESSGHIIHLGVTTTADGIITALQVLQAMFKSNKTLHEIKKGIKKFPRCVINVPHHGQVIDLNHKQITQCVKDVEAKLGKNGRVLLRASGTEPVIRIMVEGESEKLVPDLARTLVDAVNHLVQSERH